MVSSDNTRNSQVLWPNSECADPLSSLCLWWPSNQAHPYCLLWITCSLEGLSKRRAFWHVGFVFLLLKDMQSSTNQIWTKSSLWPNKIFPLFFFVFCTRLRIWSLKPLLLNHFLTVSLLECGPDTGSNPVAWVAQLHLQYFTTRDPAVCRQSSNLFPLKRQGSNKGDSPHVSLCSQRCCKLTRIAQ